MTTVEIFETSEGQAVCLRDEFRFDAKRVSIRREGDAVILEPLRPTTWLAGFFDQIRIDDPAVLSPPQGEFTPAPTFDPERWK
jgi:virulence-associated protein VagC